MGSVSRPPRLINVETRELERVTWSDTIVRHYAILSHTWGPDEDEVSFLEWQNGTARHKPGYHKIIGACERAEQDLVSYLWVDTCCIDKRDPNELSRAINSMFAWYAGAQVCYVLLSDVSPNMSRTGFNAVTQLRNSRYFTRGWTLQELLAPRDVEFYAADWSALGSKDYLLVVLAEITGIEEAVLEHRKSLRQCSVAQKLSWASNRSTTEVEDLAYCLLGIVDVTMPLLYGEGQRAFRRLQEEVLRNSGDLSVLAWRYVEPGRSSTLFAMSPADFFGSRNVVTDSTLPVSELWMTNRGLRGTLSAHSQCEAEGQCVKVLAPLNCHFAGNPDEPMVLNLTTNGADLQDYDNVFVVEPWNPFEHDVSLLTRCTAIDGQDLTRLRQVQATILLDGPLERATREGQSRTDAIARGT
ncbi:maturation of 5S rRNA [Elasticomyces elasticus]|nr:maturation of 5S rRNA [Elasticomyces elasticus]